MTSAHFSSSGRFTVQLRVPDCVYIHKNDLNFKLNAKHSIPTDLRIGTAKLVVISLGNGADKYFARCDVIAIILGPQF